jgi:threonyl-tRNA synthetase
MDKYEDFQKELPEWVNKDNFDIYKLRHTAEHILHLAMTELYPEIKRAMGPPTKDGFYFDFDPMGVKISEEDFPKIEKKMKEIVKRNLPMIREDITTANAKKMFKDNPYKIEWVSEHSGAGKNLTVYWTGDPKKEGSDPDLCKGPHIEYTSKVKHFKLLSIAGAYWRGDEKNKMLTRIYGTSFFTSEELAAYLTQIEEAKKRDHRKLLKELEMVIFSELIGAGLPMYTPKGTILRNAIYNYSRELNKKIGYLEVATPNFNRAELFKISGHYEKYKDDMLRVVSQYSEEEMFFKPMNCPQHTQIYASQTRSYRDLPWRVADFSNLARDERPGEMNGILRSRIFTQDDGHCFCTEEQIKQEFKNVIEVVKEALDVYGLEYQIRLSLWDPNDKAKYLGDPKIWEKSQKMLKDLVTEEGYEYFEGVGEAAIYGPKMDFIATDSLGRTWQISTIQLDFIQPQRFKLEYIDKDGIAKQPVMIHRAIVGSERFIGIITEHYAGAFPAWMSPDQVTIIPISDEVNDYADQIEAELNSINVRVKIDKRNVTMQSKIRDSEKMKVPYMVIIGKREKDEKAISVRYRGQQKNVVMQVSDFKTKIAENIQNRKVDIVL